MGIASNKVYDNILNQYLLVILYIWGNIYILLYIYIYMLLNRSWDTLRQKNTPNPPKPRQALACLCVVSSFGVGKDLAPLNFWNK